MNRSERLFLNFLTINGLDFIYVGDGSEIISGKNPDYIQHDKRLIIELFGDYWHKNSYPETLARVNLFDEAGYKTMIVWEHQFLLYPNLLLKDIQRFYNNVGSFEEHKIIVPKVWGHEEILVNNSEYCGKRLFLNRNGYSSIHYHKIKHEHLFVYKGKVKFTLENEELVLNEGMIVEVKPRQRHMFEGIEDSILLEFSTPHLDSDSIRITASGVRKDGHYE